MTLPSEKLITINDRAARTATTFGSLSQGGGNMVFIKKLTASSSATLSFVDGASSVVLDDTYKEYVFTFNNMHPATDNVNFSFNISVDTGSNYNVSKISTTHRAYHDEADSEAALEYDTGQDLPDSSLGSTGFQSLLRFIGNGNDECASGELKLFNPSSTTFVKHFISAGNAYYGGDYSFNDFAAGYGNTTSAVDAIQFKMSSGNIDAGKIKLYGIKDS